RNFKKIAIANFCRVTPGLVLANYLYLQGFADLMPKPDSNDAVIDLSLDTIRKSKQAIVFVNSKRSAEKVAEELARKLKDVDLHELSEKALHALSKPTTQCERLAFCLKRGVAFHHAGLVAKQRELVEDNFRSGRVRIIAATTTLAMGVDLPAFRVIMRDVKRYTHLGYTHIPVLEYHQMVGRAGRPKYDSFGEAISIAATESEEEDIVERFIRGKPEPVYSKLAVEPVLRTYLLSLISSGFVSSRKEIVDFFSRTFWAFQYKDMPRLSGILDEMLHLLEDWEFVASDALEFQSASELGNTRFKPTLLGKRVAELYLDPLTAHQFVVSLNQAAQKAYQVFSFLQLVSNTLEMRPLLKARQRDFEKLQEAMLRFELLQEEPSMFEPEYEDFLNSLKTALFMYDWAEEMDDQHLLKSYDVRPGESRVKLDIADWLLYSCHEIARILNFRSLIKDLERARLRLRYGVKEELLPLVRFKNIGRVRARMLFKNRIRDAGDVRKTDLTTLSQILGKQVALSIKEQLDDVEKPVKKGKRKGQVSIEDY
ncbi:MAG: helicase-related protein, partial [Candidatus Woesearchaeota archaeon]